MKRRVYILSDEMAQASSEVIEENKPSVSANRQPRQAILPSGSKGFDGFMVIENFRQRIDFPMYPEFIRPKNA